MKTKTSDAHSFAHQNLDTNQSTLNARKTRPPYISQPIEAPTAATLIEIVHAHLEASDFRAARTAVAEAEFNQSTEMPSARTDTHHANIASAKAHIAWASQDHSAAKAILVTAIERYPHIQSLRTRLAEVMFSAGNAADIRPVLKHIGKSTPTTNGAEVTKMAQETHSETMI